MESLICLGLFVPLVSFLSLMFLNKTLSRNLTGIIASSVVFISFICFSILLYLYTSNGIEEREVTLYQLFNLERLKADFNLRLDHLSLLMTLIITGVGFLIHVYSIGYMEHEEDYVRYFAFLNFFIFAMLLLVLAGNLFLLFFGWEGVGLASYFLIGYWYEKQVASDAAVKAFVVNRIGDLGFLFGIIFTFYLFGTSDIKEISAAAIEKFPGSSITMTALTLLLFAGCMGKSAELPLHVWLPDAMAGPTPVSALIHAATMVTAGVYLIVRLHLIYLLAPYTLEVVGVVGAATALYAALSAIAQTDLKKVLAYSTISQLGFMFLACGAAAFYSAMFHLTMHAFVKGLLFLSAGNVLHMLHGKTDMNEMGGLSKKLKITNWLFLIGVLSLSGIPPFSAFFSKDLILEQEYLAGYKTLFYMALVSSILTGAYLTRAYLLTFQGRLKTENESAKEAPYIMLIPVMILAFLAMTGGLLGATFGKIPILESFLSEVGVTPAEQGLSHGFLDSKEAYLAMFGAFLGVLIPAVLYTQYRDKLPANFKFLNQAFYVDTLYQNVIVTPLKMFSSFIQSLLEPKFFNGMLYSVITQVSNAASLLQKMQNGQIRLYAALMVLGCSFLLFYFILANIGI